MTKYAALVAIVGAQNLTTDTITFTVRVADADGSDPRRVVEADGQSIDEISRTATVGTSRSATATSTTGGTPPPFTSWGSTARTGA